jgi:hypothetical protein
MNQPINPYASPQAELTDSPFSDSVKLTLPGLRTTGIGLSMVYYGIIIVLIAFLVEFSTFTDIGSALGFLTTVYELTLLVGGLLMFAGQIVCLFVPWQSGAKGYIVAAVALQLVSYAPLLFLLLTSSPNTQPSIF